MYVIYVDCIFVISLLAQGAILFLMNLHFMKIANPGKMIAACVLSGILSVLPFCSPGNLWGKNLIFNGVGTVFILLFVFQMKTWEAFVKVFTYYIVLLIYFGGVVGLGVKLLECLGKVPGLLEICCLLTVAYVAGLLWEIGKKRDKGLCRAILILGQHRVEVEAFIDSGNGLVEPISGKPVCILGKEIGQNLFTEKEVPYRAVPYHSIGKKRGILPGYLLPELQIERNGLVKKMENVYVAICDEQIQGMVGGRIQMLLNPRVLTGE